MRNKDYTDHLTPAQTRVLQALARGLSNNEIAAELEKGVATVKYQLLEVYGKLEVHNRVQATHEAQRMGLIG
jgi:DNA-binding NarL/FixJ family response regulator